MFKRTGDIIKNLNIGEDRSELKAKFLSEYDIVGSPGFTDAKLIPVNDLNTAKIIAEKYTKIKDET